MAIPTVSDKVILVDFSLTETNTFSLQPIDTQRQFSTTDRGTAFIGFKAETIADGMTADISLANLDDDSRVNRTFTVTTGTNFDATNKIFYYQIPDDEIVHYGNWIGYGKFTDNATSKTWTGTKFKYSISRDITNDPETKLIVMDDVNSFIASMQTIKSEMEADHAQALLDQTNYAGLLENGVMTTQIIAKLTELETTYAPNMVSLTQQLADTDFIEQVSRLIGGYEKMYYKRENSLGWVTVMLRNKSEHVSWAFRNNVYDDFYILGDCFYGDITEALQMYQNVNYETLTGTWVTTAPNSHYASAVGSTFTTTVTGEKIEFNPYADNRGGIWEFVCDGDNLNKKTVSVYSSTIITNKIMTLFEGLEFGEHTIVGTFMGDDPSNVPSTGAGKSRGWVWFDSVSAIKTFRTYKTQLTNNRAQDLLVGFSNKEFAFSIRQQGSTAAHRFVPMHNSVGTAFEKEPIQFVADSAIFTEAQIAALAVGDFIECTKFSVLQSVYGRNPDSGATNLIEIKTNVTINKNGNVEVTGKMQPLVNVEIANGYGIMFPVAKAVTTKVISSKGNEYPTVLTNYTSTFLTAEGDTTKSMAFISSENKNYITALRYNDIRNTLKMGKVKTAPMWIEHRDATLQKLYFRPFYNEVLLPTDIFKFSATFNCGKIVGIYDLI